MKDTQVAAVVAPAGISLSPAEPRLFGGAASLEDKTEVSSQMKKRHAPSVRLATKCQLREREDVHFRPPLCYPLPAAPLS
jgi:hypothetical protein